MTPTEQDKELKEEIECVLMHFMELGIAGDPEKELNRASDMLYDLITADRKRVASSILEQVDKLFERGNVHRVEWERLASDIEAQQEEL